MRHTINRAAFAAALFCGVGAIAPAANAEIVAVTAVMAPQEQIRLDFEDGTKHFVLMVRREGTAEGQGLLAGTAVTEFGMHDIVPGVDGDPHGYLVFADGDGDKVYIKWVVRAIFVPNPAGKQKFKLLDYGHWEVAGASGKFSGLMGVGSLTIKPVSKTDRLFTLTGDLVAAPE